jgi:hypothetical protein
MLLYWSCFPCQPGGEEEARAIPEGQKMDLMSAVGRLEVGDPRRGNLSLRWDQSDETQKHHQGIHTHVPTQPRA